ncbi:MAG: hypothetical protein J6Q81_01095 [Lentisphaeria bacterium]|nr:hypothetical protein [Lentisphaeria bacterium]
MSRRRKKEESSLEMLLDTMCNTFGGVMFIAISLLVILSIMTKDIPIPDEKADLETLQQEIISLQKVYADLLKELQLKAEEIKLRKNSNIDSKYKELLLLMQLVQDTRLKIEAARLADKTLTAALQKLNQKLELLKKEALQQERELEKLQKEQLEMQEKLAKLTEAERQAPQLAFRVMERSDREPFFLMLRDNMVYPVGPWGSDASIDQIDTAVNAMPYHYQNERLISCTIKPGAGIAILDGNDFSDQFQQLLNKLPPGRVPKFFITPSSAPTAYKMREIMKQRNIYHGTVIAAEDDSPFMFKFTQKAEYEY